MVPNTSVFVIDEENTTIPDNTYSIALDINKNTMSNHIVGMTDGLSAIAQTIYFILNSERYEHIIYSWDYGIELLVRSTNSVCSF